MTHALSIPRSSRYWLNLIRFTALCLLVGMLVLIMGMAVKGIQLTDAAIHPGRVPINHTPADYSITSYEEIAFATADGLTLRGWFIPSQNGAVIILGHGHAHNRTAMLPYAQMLAWHGYGSLLFDWRAHGESDGDITTLGYQEMQDVDAALDYLLDRPDVDPERIGVIGISMGAAIWTMGAARHQEISAAVLEAAYPALEDVTRHRFTGLPALAPLALWWGQLQTGSDVDNVRPIDELCAVSPRPLFLIYGTNDDSLPADSADRMLDAACEPVELWLVEGGGHTDTYNNHPEEFEQRVIEFFDATLLSD